MDSERFIRDFWMENIKFNGIPDHADVLKEA
jgi:hypothetical protein